MKSCLQDRLLGRLFACAEDPVLIEDACGLVLDLNPAAERAYGCTREAIIGQPSVSLVPEDQRDDARRLRERVLSGEQVGEVEAARIGLGGTRLDARLTSFPVLTVNGEAVATIANVAHAPARADAHGAAEMARALVAARTAELTDAEERFALAVRGAGVGVYDHDLRVGTLWYSPRVKEMLGYRDDELDITIEWWNSRLHPDDIDAIKAARVAHFELGRPYDVAYRIRCRSGAFRWFRSHGESLRDAAGAIYRTAGTIEDVDELRHKAAALAESKAELRATIDNIPAAVFLRDVEGRFIGVNPVYEAIYGVRDAEVRGRMVDEVLPADEAARYRAHDREVIDAGTVIEHELVLDHDGERRTFAAIKYPVLSAQGEVQAVGGVEFDITERKRLEEQMVQARRTAESANRAKSEFLSNMSHELRTPLNGVLGYVQILQKDRTLGAEQRTCLDAIGNCGTHLLSLINDVLDLARIESGRVDIERKACDLHALLDGVADIIRPRADSAGLELRWTVQPEVPAGIICDQPKLRQVLVNLLGNAVKFTPTGHVALDVAERPRGRLRFTVRDSGIGMTTDELGVIFDAFKQVEGGKLAGGTGLGLAISEQLVRALDGTLTVESEPGVGTTFTLDLPLIEADLGSASALESEALDDGEILELAPGQAFAVLIVDDRDENRDILRRLLRQAGFSTAEASDGAEALERMGEQDFPLVLMDIRMPGMNGIEAVKRIRADERLREAAVIAVSASVFPDSAERFAEVGFDGYIAKPFRASELFARVGEHLGAQFVVTSPGGPSPAATDACVPGAALAPEVAARLAAAAEIGDIAALEEIAVGLEIDPATSAVAKTITDLTAMLDLDALQALGHEPGGTAPGKGR